MPEHHPQESLIPVERITNQVYLIRGHKVMLDSDLAQLYGVDTKILNRAVRRNKDRFPEDFMFQLRAEEEKSLRFHFGTSKEGRGGRRYRPYVFTEQGMAMLSSVLRSDRAVQMNIRIMRAFVKLRELLATNKDVARKLEDIERKQTEQEEKIDRIVEVIEALMAPEPVPPARRIGFAVREDEDKDK